MTHLQRSVMVMILAGIFLFGILFCSKESSEKIREQWIHIKTEQFLEKMCRVGKCSYEELQLFHKALNLGSVSSEIRLEEYQKESNSAEKPCYYLVLWDEISEQLVEDGVYEFEKGSVINVCIRVTDRVHFREYQTYGKVK